MPTKLVRVLLDITSNPPVLVDPVAWGRNKTKLKWLRDPDSPKFDFESFEYYVDGSLSNPEVKAASITANNDDSNDNDDHEYTITVIANGVEYATTETYGPPTGDKPVIRN